MTCQASFEGTLSEPHYRHELCDAEDGSRAGTVHLLYIKYYDPASAKTETLHTGKICNP